MEFGREAYSRSRIKVTRWYDALAERYDELYGEEQRRKFKLAEVKGKGVVLDCGCGTGLLLANLSPGPMTVGLDLSEKMLRQAKKRLGSGVHLVQGDALTPPFKASAFDTVYSFTVIEPERCETFIKAISGLLREGGMVVLSALKKVFNPQILRGLTEASGLTPVDVMDVEGVKDYVVVCFKRNGWKSPPKPCLSSPCPKHRQRGR
ncbi:MAG: class I SAM-dependent methyltransferase [Candidatus Bathyarchaeia archaeon]